MNKLITFQRFNRYIRWKAGQQINRTFSKVCSFEDLCQMGRIAVWKCQRTCKYTKIEQVKPYVFTAIGRSMYNYARDAGCGVFQASHWTIDKAQKVFAWTYCLGYTYEEVADLLGYKSTKSIRSLQYLYRSFKKREINVDATPIPYYHEDSEWIDLLDEFKGFDRILVEDRLAGYSIRDIAKRHSINRDMVHKKLKRLKYKMRACRLTAKTSVLHTENGSSILSSPTNSF